MGQQAKLGRVYGVYKCVSVCVKSYISVHTFV